MTTSHRPETLNVLYSVVQHGEEAHDPFRWSWEPSVIAGTVLFVAIYLYGVGPLRRRCGWAEGMPSSQVALFLSGVLVFFLSLVSPLDALSDEYLFSAHMVQHVLMALIAPPLLLLGTPEWLLRPLLRPRPLLPIARFLTYPATAFVLFNLTFALWHWPTLYELALEDERVHIAQHLSFITTGVLNWWPVLSPVPAVLPRLSHPLRLLYLFANCQPGVALGALFVLSRDVLYKAYVDAPRVFANVSPHTDQQLGGLIMWIPGNAIYFLALSIVFLRWSYSSGAAQRRSPS